MWSVESHWERPHSLARSRPHLADWPHHVASRGLTSRPRPSRPASRLPRPSRVREVRPVVPSHEEPKPCAMKNDHGPYILRLRPSRFLSAEVYTERGVVYIRTSRERHLEGSVLCSLKRFSCCNISSRNPPLRSQLHAYRTSDVPFSSRRIARALWTLTQIGLRPKQNVGKAARCRGQHHAIAHRARSARGW